ncbi:MAG TPA: DUF1800 domain-containing protein [Rudaea sp.]|jgi:uncharacterized protein (DUF1800 family)|nr:DUF1800 domain-containing protein [Rudaea sp.]
MQTKLSFFFALTITGANAFAADAPAPMIGKDDLLWLNRITYGADEATIQQFRALGRKKFLDVQLRANDDHLPAPIQQRIDGMSIAHTDLQKTIEDFAKRRKEIKADGKTEMSAEQKKEYVREGADLVRQTINRELLRAVYSPDQLKEQMVWFWLNQFNVFARKGAEPWLVSDYAEHAIRPYAMGKFRDLVLATLTHPAMLVYLDNVRNAKDHANENYARELMELQTLGVDAGYTQKDVQELARILTGVSVEFVPRNVRLGRFSPEPLGKTGAAFFPARHDFGNKTLLGQTIRGDGFKEVEQAVDLLVKQPQCARFVSRRMAEYFVADQPPKELVDAMAHTFERSGGDIAETLRTMFESKAFDASLGNKFKDPMHFVVSALRYSYNGATQMDTDVAVNWLGTQGEVPFGHQSPDGYPLTESGWASSGQMSRRFEIARAIGAGRADKVDVNTKQAPPELAGSLFVKTMLPYMSQNSLAALEKAKSPVEWNTYLLSSPEFNYR